VYGSADVFSNLVNLLLLRFYTSRLEPADYRDLAILALFSAVAKILFRLGLDAGFFRLHYDLDERDRRKLAGTVALFSAAVSTSLFALVALGAMPLGRALLGPARPARWLVLAAADIYAGSFAFVPLNQLRIQDRPGLFSCFSVGRHALSTGSKVVLLLGGYGVTGVLWSDLIGTTLFSLALQPILLRSGEIAFSWPLLRPVLSFGVPKVPHGFLVQVQNLADRKILDLFVAPAEVGLYHVAYTLGAGVKFALSAFEPAWGPFVYSQIRSADAPRTLARIATYVWVGFVAVGLAVAVMGREIIALMTQPRFHPAAPVVPVVTLAYVLHGAFLLTSIGIGIEKKARYYPLVTAAAAGANLLANFALIPRLGMMGAAWATVISYFVMAGLGLLLSHRLYPIPFEWSRILTVTLAGGASFALSRFAPERILPAVAFKLAALVLFPAGLYASGFFARTRGQPMDLQR
jgi:O-antigen/teichoic acid export membrane protein